MEHFSIRRAARNCGLSPHAPYNYFENSEALLLAIRKEIIEKPIQQAMERVNAQEEDLVQKVASFAIEVQKIFLQHAYLLEQIFEKQPMHWYTIAKDNQLILEEQNGSAGHLEKAMDHLILRSYLEGMVYLLVDGYLPKDPEEMEKTQQEQISLLLQKLGWGGTQ